MNLVLLVLLDVLVHLVLKDQEEMQDQLELLVHKDQRVKKEYPEMMAIQGNRY